MADGTAMVYRKAYILSAGFTFDYEDVDVRKHVTNLSINKRIQGHPGQVPCDLPTQYPKVLAFLNESLFSCFADFLGCLLSP